MTNRTTMSIIFMILGLLIIVIPMYIFPVCPPTETIVQATGHKMFKFMKCHWTEQAELGIGSVIFVLGLLMFFIKSNLIRAGISLSLMVIAILAAAIPTVLIGVCPNEMMICNMGTLPALVLVSGLLLIIAAINTTYLAKRG